MRKYIIMMGLLMAAITTNAQMLAVNSGQVQLQNNDTWVTTGLSITTVNTGVILVQVSLTTNTPQGSSPTNSWPYTGMASGINWGLFNSANQQVASIHGWGTFGYDSARLMFAMNTYSIVLTSPNVPAGTYILKAQRGNDPAGGQNYNDNTMPPVVLVNYSADALAQGNDPTDALNALTQRVSAIETQISSINSQISTIQNDITSIKNTLTAYYNELTFIRSQITAITGRLDNHDADIAALQNQARDLSDRINQGDAELQRQLDETNARITSLQNLTDRDLDQIRADGTAANDKIAKLQSDLLLANAELAGRIAALENKTNKRFDKLDDLAWAGVGLGSSSLLSLFGYGLANDDDVRTSTKEMSKSPNTTNKAAPRPSANNTLNKSTRTIYPSNQK